MNYLKQIQTGIDFIEANLHTELDSKDIARHAGISQWHFQRIFKALTNETLKTYVRARRMANAMDKLLSTDRRILDVALDAGYETQESFSRSFKQQFRMTPGEFRQLGDSALFLRKVKIDEAYLRHINQNISTEPERRQQASMLMVGLKTSFYSVDSDKNNLGDRLPPLWDAFIPRMAEITGRIDGDAYGVVQQSNNSNDGEQLEYFAAVAVRQESSVPNGMEQFSVPACQYAMFSHRGNPDTIDRTVNYAYSTWLTQSGYQHTYGPDLEIYGEGYIPDSDDSQMFYGIPISPSA